MSEELSARVSLLDAQLVDAKRLPVGRIDDLEFSVPDAGKTPELTGILTGSEALGTRIGGGIGTVMARVSTRLRSSEEPRGPTRIDPALITELEPLVRLRLDFDALEHVAGLERWLADRFVGRLPGAGDEAE